MTAQPDHEFMQAVTAYQQKRFAEAVALCRALLENRPDHAACLHLLGVSEYGLGNGDIAEDLLRRSITLRPGFAEMHFSFAQILAARGKYAESLLHYDATLLIKPQHAEAHFARGNVLKMTGHPDEAEEAYNKALEIKPDYPEALNNLGVCRFDKGDFDHAIRLHEQAIALRPDYAAAFNNLGNVFKAQGKWGEAIGAYRQGLWIEPHLLQALNNLGLASLYGAADMEQALSCFRQILDHDPNHVPALTHMGIVLCLQSRFAEGLKFYDRALALQPDYRDALNNKGNALRALGRVDQAIDAYRRVIALKPDDAEAHHNLAVALLTQGDFAQGWAEYESRWDTLQLVAARRDFAQPQWRGEPGQGGVLLIHAEQGFGDTLQFCRYAALAAERGWRVIVEVQPELLRLLRNLSGVEKIIGRGEKLPAFDMHCPMLSLPLAFGETEAIPANVPYLTVDADAVAAWRKRLAGDAKPKIGLVWGGNPRLFSLDLAAANRRRSVPPEKLAPLARAANVQFYNLQKDATAMPPGLAIIDFMGECGDFADTAALIMALDLVISVDTSVAHLAGALGKPVWLLNRHDTCWRWLTERSDSAWYPAMRLFRQSVPGQWDDVIEEVTCELQKFTPPA